MSTWHEAQDAQITNSLSALDAVHNSCSAIVRLGTLGDELLRAKHFHNVLAERRKDETFTLMDMGCGRGDFLEHMGRFFPNARLFGCDPNEASVQIARTRVEQANIQRKSFSSVSGIYDVVVCCEVFEHVEDYESLLDKLYEITAPGGILSISTPSGWMYRIPRRFTIETAIRNWSWYKRNCLEPEKNWSEAIAVHPGIFPAKLIRLCEKRGFKLVARQSSLWLLNDDGLIHRYYHWRARENPQRAAIDYINLVVALEGLMNWLPLFRFRESRFVLSLRK